jgi:hypothetical protein
MSPGRAPAHAGHCRRICRRLPTKTSGEPEQPRRAEVWSTARKADTVFTATPTATQASLPSRVAVRWYQLAVIVLGVALAAVTALAVYLAVNNSTAAAAVPGSTAEPGYSGTPAEHPCWQQRVPC